MKVLRIAIVAAVTVCIYGSASAENKTFDRWGRLIDVAYKFSWYPKKDYRDLISMKSEEYGATLEEYCGIMRKTLASGSSETGVISVDAIEKGKAWKEYLRFAVAEFCLFLMKENETYLKNAQAALSLLSGKMELANIAFWHYLFQSYEDLHKKDRDAFIATVFRLWQNVILKLEANDVLMMGTKKAKTEFIKNLDHLYENVAHLIITRAIIESTIPDLDPLSVVILSLNEKLDSQAGYKNILTSVVERMHGLKSDNSNLNFAVAFVEATANQYEFEEEKSEAFVHSKYRAAETYYNLALSWAETPKGRFAILTQHMGFKSYIIRRLIDKDPLLINDEIFINLPSETNQVVKDAFAMYEALARKPVQQGGFVEKGFQKRKHYIAGMRQLWDASAKLLLMQSAYFKSVNRPGRREDLYMAESPLLLYLSFFKKTVRVDSEIIPDNAFFLAAHAFSELGALYRDAAEFSTGIESHNRAFDYQLQAVQLFPLDVMGILQLAHQTNKEGRLNRYLQEVSPVAFRFRESKVLQSWTGGQTTAHQNCMAVLKNVIPDIIDQAYYLVRFLGNTGKQETEDALYFRVVVLTRLLKVLKMTHSEKDMEDTINSMASLDFKDRPIRDVFKESLPPAMIEKAETIPNPDVTCDFIDLKSELYGSIQNPIHSFLRALYYEKAGN